MSEQTIDQGIDRVAVAPAAVIGRLASRRRVAAIALGLAALVALWYGEHWWTLGRFVETTDDAYVGGDVTPIAPHVAGFVAQILVADNQYVRQGQPLVRLDPRDFQAALDRATATVGERQAALANLQAKTTLQQATIRQAEADLAAKKAAAVFADEDAIRYRTLARVSAGSVQSSQRALAATQTAQAAVLASAAALDAARQQLAVLETEIAGAKAAEAQAEADLRTAQLDRGYTEIDSPIDGYVGDRLAQVGAYVTSGTTLLSVVPAHGLWIDANFKENELARMSPGQKATVAADVLAGRVFHGHVVSLAPATGAVFSVIPPQNATGNFTKIVQRVPVRIVLDDDSATLGLLRPGLSTTVAVDTRSDPRSAP
ncbi:MAG: HlyD family secretion protein [Alphaproteobacteria bacterium]|nr:HlyD family secretion protein [Alphaproteobacteria bacterium]